MKTIDLVYFNAGGGHRAAAQALQRVLEARADLTVRLVNLVQVLDPRQQFRRLTGLAPEDLYNRRLQSGFTLGLGQELKVLQALIRLGHRSLVKTLAQHWALTEPDLVVSLVPNFNRALAESVSMALPGTGFVVVLTDMADHPPHFWIEPGLDQTVVCGTPHATEQARGMGYRGERLVEVSGMVLRPEFHRGAPWTPETRAARHAEIGLDPERSTGLVTFGGQGSQAMRRIAETLPETQLVFLCGHNQALAEELRRLSRPVPHAVFGFSDDMPALLALGDFFIGKPGPGALSEAVQMGLPVITFRNAHTMPQERFNTEWVREQGVGVVVRGIGELPAAVPRLLDALPAYRRATSRIVNTAVFDVGATLALRAGAQAAAGEPGPALRSTISSLPSWCSTSAVRLSTQSPSLQ